MPAVEGGAQLRAVALRLRAAGQLELKRAMYRNLRAATLPAREAVQASERAALPKRGGLNEWVASTPVSHRTLIGPKTAGVRIVQSKKGRAKPHDLKKANDTGVIRHPVYRRPGRKQAWVDQTIPSGWFDRPLLALQPAAAARMQAAMHETSRVAGFKP